VIIWIVSGVLVYMAVLRVLRGTYKLEPDTMIVVAAIGVVINIV
jgi:Co/Zn/Cd efflux system component